MLLQYPVSIGCHTSPGFLQLLFLVVVILVFNGADAAASSSLQSLDVPSRSLSRHRRFIVPKSSNWRFIFRIRFQLRIPLMGPTNANARLTATVPFQARLPDGKF